MKPRRLLPVLAVFAAPLLFATLAGADPIGFYSQGGTLPGAPAYLWNYGCSPTAAGMMIGSYDVRGFSGLRYDNLVPGGQAEDSTWPVSPSSSPLADSTIASAGHIHDFYADDHDRGTTNIGRLGDDRAGPRHSFDSLADFMGTSQDSVGNPDGTTTFYYWTNGDRFTAEDAFTYGVWNRDGMYGLWEYFAYAGYTAPKGNFFTQATDNRVSGGFSFADYMHFIDLGAVLVIQVRGHSMFGYGYDAGTGSVILHDTWSQAVQSMPWGGSYARMELWGVTVLEPAGGSPLVPEPGTLALLGSGLAGAVRVRLRRRALVRGQRLKNPLPARG